MRIEARIIKRYCFRDRYAILFMEAPGMREELLLYIQSDNRDEMVFVQRVLDCTLDDTDRHLREVEARGDKAVKLYEETYGGAAVPQLSSSELPQNAVEAKKEEVPVKKEPKAAQPAKSMSTQKRFRSAEEEERKKARSLAMLQRNSLIDYRYNRQGNLVKQLMEGSEEALVSDIFSVVELVNRRMADDIRPLLLSMLPYYHNADFDTEYQMTRDKETTIRYVVNEHGLITACTVNGGRYPLCLTILMILRQLAEQSEEGIDAFHDRIMKRMGG